MSDDEGLLGLAVEVAEAAGSALRARVDDAGRVVTKSSATDPVSEADEASERLLVEWLRAARPDDAIVGEEGADQHGGSGLRWVLDPLDGTVNFLYGRRGWAVSVACADDDGARVGAVCDPLHGETFAAVRGRGAFCGPRRLAVTDPVALEQALIGTGFAYDPACRREQGALAARVVARARDVRREGSAALDLCAVAAGRLDGYYEDYIAEWDWAAGALIAAEAGAVVRPFGARGLVVAGPALIGPLGALVGADAPVGDTGAAS